MKFRKVLLLSQGITFLHSRAYWHPQYARLFLLQEGGDAHEVTVYWFIIRWNNASKIQYVPTDPFGRAW